MDGSIIDNSVSIDKMSEHDINVLQNLSIENRLYNRIKRVFDAILFVIFIIPSLILIVVFGLLIKIDSPGPILFRHKRLGKDMKPFETYKLRSMRMSSGPDVTLQDDNRITKVGKFIRRFRIDEVPQIFNVFLGQMSFVGPRPLAPLEYVESHDLFEKRTLVKPGITGLAQVNGGSDIDNLTKLKYDAYYIKHLSFLLDLKIILKTFGVIITGDGSR